MQRQQPGSPGPAPTSHTSPGFICRQILLPVSHAFPFDPKAISANHHGLHPYQSHSITATGKTRRNCDMDAGENEIRLEKPATALRRGWTTGACATAATKAALTALLTGEFPDPVEITLPKRRDPELCACPGNPRRRSCNGRHRQGCR
jgi:hypothetical protein